MNSNERVTKLQEMLVVKEIWRTCLNCIHWREGCILFNAMPPPAIIVHGCKDHENDIPF